MSDLGAASEPLHSGGKSVAASVTAPANGRWHGWKKIMTTTHNSEASPEVRELKDEELENVFGGKASFNDFNFTHHVDKASPVLFPA
jgi:type VI protein secretion system component Hcp